jgi:hypothetical protein
MTDFMHTANNPAPSMDAGRDPEMKQAIASLTLEVEQLQAVVGVLSARLGPMLNAGKSQLGEVPGDLANMEAEYPNKVHTLAYAIADQRRTLQGLVTRLEV